MKFRTKSADYILQFRPVNRVYRFFVIWPHSWSAGLFQWSRNLTLHKVHKMQDWHFQNRIVMHMAFLMQLKACTVTPSVCGNAIDQQPGHQQAREQQGHWQKRKKRIQVEIDVKKLSIKFTTKSERHFEISACGPRLSIFLSFGLTLGQPQVVEWSRSLTWHNFHKIEDFHLQNRIESIVAASWWCTRNYRILIEWTWDWGNCAVLCRQQYPGHIAIMSSKEWTWRSGNSAILVSTGYRSGLYSAPPRLVPPPGALCTDAIQPWPATRSSTNSRATRALRKKEKREYKCKNPTWLERKRLHF